MNKYASSLKISKKLFVNHISPLTGDTITIDGLEFPPPVIDNITVNNKNVIIGYQTGDSLMSGNDNILIGRNSGNNIISGNNNLIIGNDAGTLLDMSNCIFIGHEVGSNNMLSNRLMIDNSNTNLPLIDGHLSGSKKIKFNAEIVTLGTNTSSIVQISTSPESTNKTETGEYLKIMVGNDNFGAGTERWIKLFK